MPRPSYCVRRDLERWLLRNGFSRAPWSGDHAHFERAGHKVTLVAGRSHVTANEALSTIRTLEKLGFDRRAVRRALRRK
jgi:predicted RNA binding protein YcfA (HicA-like mRNA interferase family)